MRATKESGFDWLGTVPENWVISRIGACVIERRETVSDTDFQPLSVTKSGVVPRLESAAKSDNAEGRKLIREGDFVINSRSDRKGSSGVSALDGSCSVVYIVLELLRFAPEYAHHLFRSQPFQEEFYRWGSGIVDDLWSTRYSAMKQIAVPVPPLAEQRAIADFLGRETAKIDTLIAKQEQLITTLGERRKAVIWRGVTQSVGAVKLGVGARLDWKLIVPNSWRVKPLWMVTGFSTGWTPPSGNDAFYSDEYPWVNISDLGPRELRTTVKGLSSFATNSIRLKKTLRGQLMFSFKLSIGQVSFAGLDCYTNEAIASFHSSEQLRLDYAFYMLPICVPENAGENIYGAKMLNAQRIKTARIILPPLEEQESVASFLNGATTKIDSLIARARKANAFLVERRQSLISAAVTGKIDLSKGV